MSEIKVYKKDIVEVTRERLVNNSSLPKEAIDRIIDLFMEAFDTHGYYDEWVDAIVLTKPAVVELVVNNFIEALGEAVEKENQGVVH